MNIVEKEAKQFGEILFEGDEVNDLKNLKSKLAEKLYDFKRHKDKLDFLKVLRQDTVNDQASHKLKCKSGNCSYLPEREIGLFVIDQEIEDLNQIYSFEAEESDRFNASEESTLHSKLNDISEQLRKQGLGQEIIFEEIDSLKNHFNLGRKTWFQLAKGKLIDLMLKKAIDTSISSDVYSNLTEGFTEITGQLK